MAGSSRSSKIIAFLSQGTSKYFSPPDTSKDYLEKLERLYNNENMSESTLLELSSHVQEVSKIKHRCQLIFYVFKLLLFFFTAALIIFEVSSLIVSILSGLSEIVIESVAEIGPFISILIALIVLIGAYEAFMGVASTPDIRQTFLERLRIVRKKNSSDEQDELIESKEKKSNNAIIDVNDTGSES